LHEVILINTCLPTCLPTYIVAPARLLTASNNNLSHPFPSYNHPSLIITNPGSLPSSSFHVQEAGQAHYDNISELFDTENKITISDSDKGKVDSKPAADARLPHNDGPEEGQYVLKGPTYQEIRLPRGRHTFEISARGQSPPSPPSPPLPQGVYKPTVGLHAKSSGSHEQPPTAHLRGAPGADGQGEIRLDLPPREDEILVPQQPRQKLYLTRTRTTLAYPHHLIHVTRSDWRPISPSQVQFYNCCAIILYLSFGGLIWMWSWVHFLVYLKGYWS
jgi:hypothetical protein